MTILETLKEKNPSLRLYAVTDPEFEPYGRLLPVSDPEALSAALEAEGIPEAGNRYVPSVPALEATADAKRAARSVFGGMAIQAGYCNGRGYALNAEEYHKCSEVNYSTTGLVLLLALPEQIRDRRLQSRDIVGFYLPPQTMVEIHPRVLHFAPCRVTERGFTCLVILEYGTNGALEAEDPSLPGEEGLLWMRNKWLICHPDSPQAAQGAFVGITGENLTLRI